MADDSGSSASEGAAIRQDMVDAAVRFMSGPKVRQTPREEQTAFLRTKGLTDAEIALASERVASTSDAIASTVPSLQQQPLHANNVMMQPQRSAVWRDYANVLVIVAGTSYGFYRLCRQWLLPQFFGIPDPEREAMRRVEEQVSELQNSVKFVMDSVEQTLSAVQRQQDALDRAVTLFGTGGGDRSGVQHQIQELKTEIGVVKSLLLSRNQFAPLPVANAQPTVPAWQLAQSTAVANKLKSASSNGYKTPPPSICNDDDEEKDNVEPANIPAVTPATNGVGINEGFYSTREDLEKDDEEIQPETAA